MQTVGEREIIENSKRMNFTLVCKTSIGQLYQLKIQDFINIVMVDSESRKKIEQKVEFQKEEIDKILQNINQNYNKYKEFIFTDETIEDNFQKQDQYKSLVVSSTKWKTIIDQENLQDPNQINEKRASNFRDYFKKNLFNIDTNLIQTPRDETQKKVQGRQNVIMTLPKKNSKHESAHSSYIMDNSHISSHQSLIEYQNEQDSQLIENHLNEKQYEQGKRKYSSQINSPTALLQPSLYSSKQPNKMSIDLRGSIINQSARNSIFSQMGYDPRNSVISQGANEQRNSTFNQILFDQKHTISQPQSNTQLNNSINFECREKIEPLEQQYSPIKFQESFPQNPQIKQTKIQKQQTQLNSEPQVKRQKQMQEKKVRITQVERNLHRKFHFIFYQRIKDQERNPEGVKTHVYEDVIQKMPYKKTPQLKQRPFEIMNKSNDLLDKTKQIKQEILIQKTQSMQELTGYSHFPISVKSQIIHNTPKSTTNIGYANPTSHIISIAPQKKRQRPVSMYNLRKYTIEQEKNIPSIVERLSTTKETLQNASQIKSINSQLRTYQTTHCNNTLSTIGNFQMDTKQTHYNEKTLEDIFQEKVKPFNSQSQDYQFKYFLPTNKRNQINNNEYKFSQVYEQKQKSVNQINTSINEIDSLFICSTKSQRNMDFKPLLLQEDLNKSNKQHPQQLNMLQNQNIIKTIQQNSVLQQIQSKTEVKQKTQVSNISKILSQQMVQNMARKLDSHIIKSQNPIQKNQQNKINISQMTSQ